MKQAIPDNPRINSYYLSATGSKIGVLLIHGFTGSPLDLKELGDYLMSNKLNVLGWRLPGHASDPKSLNQMKSSDWLESVSRGYHQLAIDNQKIFIIGYSFGGNLALEAILRNNLSISGLITICTPIYFPREYLHRWIIPLISRFKSDYRKYWIKPADRYIYEQQGKYAIIPLRAANEMYQTVQGTKALLSEFKCPIMIMHTVGDSVVRPISAQYIFEHIGSSDKKLIWIDESAHRLANWDSKEKVFNQILNFIKEQSHAAKNTTD